MISVRIYKSKRPRARPIRSTLVIHNRGSKDAFALRPRFRTRPWGGWLEPETRVRVEWVGSPWLLTSAAALDPPGSKLMWDRELVHLALTFSSCCGRFFRTLGDNSATTYHCWGSDTSSFFCPPPASGEGRDLGQLSPQHGAPVLAEFLQLLRAVLHQVLL